MGREMRSIISIWWKVDSYFIVCFSVKTTVTILECVFHHCEYLTPGGGAFYTHEKSCDLEAAQLKEHRSWNYLEKSCSARQGAAEDEAICTVDLPKAKKQRNTCPGQECSPKQSCTCSWLCPATANLAFEHVFETRLTFDRHPPLQLQRIPMGTAATTFMEDLRVHICNWVTEGVAQQPAEF